MDIFHTNGKIKQRFNKNSFEKESWRNNRVVCGIDEVGRGCLAGPLVTAAVILPPNRNTRLIKDSKILTEQERLKAYTWITEHCWHAVGIVDHHIIDKHNVWHATLISMKKALIHVLANCPYTPESILVDAMPLKLLDTPYKSIPIYHFYKGEQRSSSIAAASIVAKVTRDSIMKKFDSIYPGFLLSQHKGYSTPKHKAILRERAPLVIHRQTFLKKITLLNQEECHENDEQQTIYPNIAPQKTVCGNN